MLLSTSIVLIPDWTSVVQGLIFLAVLYIVSVFLLRPLMQVRDCRRKATIEAEARTRELQTITVKRLEEYERRISLARQEGAALKEQARQEGYAQASELMGKARASAIQQLDQAKARIAKEAGSARQLLEKNASEFARLIAERILERSIHEQPRHASAMQDDVRRRSTQGNS